MYKTHVIIENERVPVFIDGSSNGAPIFLCGLATHYFGRSKPYSIKFSNAFRKKFKIFACNLTWSDAEKFPKNKIFELTLDDIAEHIEDMLKQLVKSGKLGKNQKIVIAGHSGYGMLAFYYAYRYPKAVKQVQIYGTAPTLGSDYEKFERDKWLYLFGNFFLFNNNLSFAKEMEKFAQKYGKRGSIKSKMEETPKSLFAERIVKTLEENTSLVNLDNYYLVMEFLKFWESDTRFTAYEQRTVQYNEKYYSTDSSKTPIQSMSSEGVVDDCKKEAPIHFKHPKFFNLSVSQVDKIWKKAPPFNPYMIKHFFEKLIIGVKWKKIFKALNMPVEIFLGTYDSECGADEWFNLQESGKLGNQFHLHLVDGGHWCFMPEDGNRNNPEKFPTFDSVILNTSDTAKRSCKDSLRVRGVPAHLLSSIFKPSNEEENLEEEMEIPHDETLAEAGMSLEKINVNRLEKMLEEELSQKDKESGNWDEVGRNIESAKGLFKNT